MMEAPPPVGSTVRHVRFGPGRVLRLIGQKMRVAFELLGNQVRDVDIEETTVVTAGGAEQSTGTLTPERRGTSPPQPAAEYGRRLVVECLRQGVPPPGTVAAWTVGFQRPRDQVDRALANAATRGRGVVLVVEATYGQGKTHLGRLASELALGHRLMTMHAELDGEALTLRRDGVPLLSRLFASVRLEPGGIDGTLYVPGLGSLLRKAPERLQREVPRDLASFAPFLSCKDDWDGNEEAIELLERYLAGETQLRLESELRDVLARPDLSLPSFRMRYGTVAERLNAQADQLKRVVRLGMEIGAKGALVVVDELDHDVKANVMERARILATLNAFIRLASEGPIVFLLLAPSAAFTFSGVEHVELPSLRDDELEKVTARVLQAYEEAFPQSRLEGQARLFARLLDRFNADFRREGWGARFFVRATIEACDLATAVGTSLDGIAAHR